MVKNLKAMMLLSLILSLIISCTKDIEPVFPTEPDSIESTNPGDDSASPEEEASNPEEENVSPEDGTNSEEKPGISEEKPDISNPSENFPGQTANSIELGTGSGDLIIDGNDTNIKGKSTILIKSGTYGYVTIKNISGNINAPIFIKNAGQVTIKSGMETNNITNVTIAGDNIPGMEYGFNFQDISYRAIVLSGKMSGVTLKSLSFKNVRDYVIYSDIAKQKYQGTAETRTERFKILNCKFDNAAGIQFSGTFSSGQDDGFVKDLEVAHNIIINSDPGVFAFFPNVQDYDIHHNVVNNLNPSNNQHNAIFQMIGNGKLHNNKFTNYQGNAIRAWVFSRGSSPSTIEIYNNMTYNTRKYSAFEIQGFSRYIVPGKTTFVNAKVYNNTAGKMNTSKDWEGVILDLYNYGGTLEYYNNLGYELIQGKPITDMINNMSDTKIIKNENNKYFINASDAVMNTTNFASKHAGIGANL